MGLLLDFILFFLLWIRTRVSLHFSWEKEEAARRKRKKEDLSFLSYVGENIIEGSKPGGASSDKATERASSPLLTGWGQRNIFSLSSTPRGGVLFEAGKTNNTRKQCQRKKNCSSIAMMTGGLTMYQTRPLSPRQAVIGNHCSKFQELSWWCSWARSTTVCSVMKLL